jgi:hypothetical protein
MCCRISIGSQIVWRWVPTSWPPPCPVSLQTACPISAQWRSSPSPSPPSCRVRPTSRATSGKQRSTGEPRREKGEDAGEPAFRACGSCKASGLSGTRVDRANDHSLSCASWPRGFSRANHCPSFPPAPLWSTLIVPVVVGVQAVLERGVHLAGAARCARAAAEGQR